jgi:hypothetical protein
MKKTYVFDYETIKNCFLAMYINIKDPKDIVCFEVSDFQNDFKDYINFLKKLYKDQNYIVSFNGLNFDSQVAYHCVLNFGSWKNLSGNQIASEIFMFVQDLINLRNTKGYCTYKHSLLPWNEIDLASINNYNNQQKFASLKWLQFNMDWPNIMDMNCKPSDILNQKQILELKRYCINDCLSTKELLTKNIEQIKIRDDLSKHFEIPLQNLSEPKLVKAILLSLLSKDLDVSVDELKKKQTYRKTILLSEAILPYISFKTKPLIDTLIKFKKLKLDAENLKGSFKHKVLYRGLEISFALGGIHGAKRGIYKAENGMIIKSFDVKSFYPNLAIRNKWAPAHYDAEIFCNRYEWFYDERLKYGKKDPLNYLYKIVLNSVFGLSNEKSSPLKDSMLTMKITCNGQLLLTQLMEELCEEIPGARPIMLNTDGGEIIFPEEHMHIYDRICKEWELRTNLVLEFEEYEKLIIWDVNNYIGIFKPYEIDCDKALEQFENTFPKPLMKKINGKCYSYPIKLKGRFEIDKALHKNKSNRIKAIAIYNYFVHGKDPEKTIKECKNIYDFCAGIRATGEWKIKQTCYEAGDLIDYKTQKTVRYVVSKRGCKLIKEEKTTVAEAFNVTNQKGDIVKRYKEGDIITKQIKVEADKVLERVVIKIDPSIPIEEYELDYNFYTKLVRNEIESVQPLSNQITLF